MEYVVKKLVDAGQGHGKVTLDEATNLLASNLIHLERMVAFTCAFMACAIRMGAEICHVLIPLIYKSLTELQSFRSLMASSSRPVMHIMPMHWLIHPH